LGALLRGAGRGERGLIDDGGSPGPLGDVGKLVGVSPVVVEIVDSKEENVGPLTPGGSRKRQQDW